LIKTQSLFRNSFFSLGLFCLLGFIASGFFIYFMFSALPVFIFVPSPFGVVFSVLGYHLSQTLKEKTNSRRFTAAILVLAMILIVVTYVFFMAWLLLYGTLVYL